MGDHAAAPAHEPPSANETLEQARARNVRDALREDVGTGDWTAEMAGDRCP